MQNLYSQITIASDNFNTPAQWTLNTAVGAPVNSVVPDAAPNYTIMVGWPEGDNSWYINDVYCNNAFACGFFGSVGAGCVPAQPGAIPNANTNYLHTVAACELVAGESNAQYNGSLQYQRKFFAYMNYDFSTSGYYNVNFSYWTNDCQGASVYYSANSGASWTYLADVPYTMTWTNITLANSVLDNKATLRFGFLWDDAKATGNYPCIDALKVFVFPLTCNFNEDKSSTCLVYNETITFSNLSAPADVSVTYNWTVSPGVLGVDWIFVNATTSTSQNPQMQFLTAKTYGVTLTVNRAITGESFSQTDSIYVRSGCGCSAGAGTANLINDDPNLANWTLSNSACGDWTTSSQGGNFNGGNPAGSEAYMQNPIGGSGCDASYTDMVWNTNLDFTAAATYNLSFKLCNEFFQGFMGSYQNILQVYISTAGAGGPWTQVGSNYGNTGSSWVSKNINLSAYSGTTNTVRIKFKGIRSMSNSGLEGDWDLGLNDILLTRTSAGGFNPSDPTATITLSAGTNPSCVGSSMTFLCSGTNLGGGAITDYNWKVNGTSVQTGMSSTYTSTTLSDGDLISCSITIGTPINCVVDSRVAYNVTIIQFVTPGVWISPSPVGKTCDGTPHSFVANPVNGGASPSYQWKINGVNYGTNSPNFPTSGTIDTLSNGSVVSVIMTSNNFCPSPNPVSDNYTIETFDTTKATIADNPTGTNCPGTSINIYVATNTASGTITYKWYINEVLQPENVNNITRTTFNNNDQIYCTINSDYTCAGTTNVITELIYGAPVIIAQPDNVSICIGNNTTFSVTATGTNLTYQWQENQGVGWNNLSNGGVYSNVTTATLNLTGVTLTMNSYQYRCVVGGICSITTNSNAATLTVSNTTSITTHPSNSQICPNTNTSFSVVATGGGLTYQWQENQGAGWNNLSNGGVYSDVTTATLNLTNAPVGMNTYQYLCVVNSLCSAPINSNAATLTFYTTPSITTQPTDVFISPGGNASFTITATGSGLTYQWQENQGAGWNNLSNGGVYSNVTTPTLNITAAPVGMNSYRYRCVITNPCAIVVISNLGTLFVSANFPAISVCQGITSANLPYSSTTNTPIQYNIDFDATANAAGFADVVLAALPASPIIITVPGAVATGTYNANLTVQNAGGCVSSIYPIQVIVNSSPSITANPNNSTICSAANASFGVTATGVGLTYQWQVNTGAGWSNLADGGVYSNVYTATMNITGAPLSYDTYQYRCVVTNTCTSVTSSAATLTVSGLPVSNSIVADNNSICTGTNVTFTATPTNGGAAPSYQWKLNGGNVGANSTTYSNSSLADGDLVTCVLTSNATCPTGNPATSNTITMSVTPSSPVSVSIVADNNSICPGINITFTATPTNGGATPSYQWKLNGGDVGANSTTYSNNSLANGDQIICVLTSNATCPTGNPANSNTIIISITPSSPASVSIVADNNPICPGINVTFTATPTNGGATPSYQWLLNGANTGINSITYSNNTLNSSDLVQVIMTSVVPCAAPVSPSSNTIDVTVYSGQWHGSVSSDWADANNWCPAIPASATDVFIPASAPNMPVISSTNEVCHHITIISGGSVTISGGSLSLYGNLINNGTYSHSAGSLIITGPVPQSTSGITVYNMTMNNSTSLTINGNLIVNGTLTLTRGIVTTGANYVIISSSSPSSVMEGAGNTNYTLSYIDGNMRRYWASNTGLYDFPCGTSSYSACAKIQNANLTGATLNYFDVKFFNSFTNTGIINPAAAQDFGTPYISIASEGEWQIDPDGTPGSGSYDLFLYLNGFSGLQDNSFAILKRPSSSTDAADWTAYGTLNPNGGLGRMVSDGYALRKNMNTFSKYSIGKSGGPLPVELLNFNAVNNGVDVDLLWSTASEINNDYFTVERAAPPNHPKGEELSWQVIATVKGAGNSSTTVNYKIIDSSPFPSGRVGDGLLYYRLKQTDYNGKFEYFGPVAVRFGEDINLHTLYFQYLNEKLHFTIDGFGATDVYIEVIDNTGKVVVKDALRTSEGSQLMIVPVSFLSSGIYFVKIFSGKSGDANSASVNNIYRFIKL